MKITFEKNEKDHLVIIYKNKLSFNHSLVQNKLTFSKIQIYPLKGEKNLQKLYITVQKEKSTHSL